MKQQITGLWQSVCGHVLTKDDDYLIRSLEFEIGGKKVDKREARRYIKGRQIGI